MSLIRKTSENDDLTIDKPRLSEVNSSTGKSKVEQYGWKIVDEPGVFQEIDKDKLRVDDSYQRDENVNKAKEIASEWSWMACGVILVARRGYMNFVYDGQTRVLAARKRADIRLLPCLVFKTIELIDEAAAFLRANTNRKLPSVYDRFKALLITKDVAALLVKKLMDDEGLRCAKAGSHPGFVRCLSLALRWAEMEPDVLERMWPMVAEITRGRSFHERILGSLCYIERRIGAIDPDAKRSLARQPWRDRLMHVGYEGLLTACADAARYHQRGGSRVWAQGVIKAMNKGCRKDLLFLDEAPDETT